MFNYFELSLFKLLLLLLLLLQWMQFILPEGDVINGIKSDAGVNNNTGVRNGTKDRTYSLKICAVKKK